MKKILAVLSLSLALFSCGSGAADGVNQTPSSTGNRVFVVDTSKSVSKLVASKKSISKSTSVPSAWQTQYDSLISTINTNTGRNNSVDGYFIFDSYGSISEFAFKSVDSSSKVAVIQKFDIPSSHLPVMLYGDNPDFVNNHTNSIQVSQYGIASSEWYVTDNYTKTSEGLVEEMTSYDGYTQSEITASPVKNSIGEVQSWYYNYNGLDGMEFDEYSPSSYVKSKYVFNNDGTISLWSEGEEKESNVGNVAYTYENGIVKTMTITSGSNTYIWKYDSQGRVIETTGLAYYDSGTSHSYTTKYTYDSNGIVTNYTKYDNDLSQFESVSTTTYTLNTDGTIKSFNNSYSSEYGADTGTISMTYTRDSNGNITNVHAKISVPDCGIVENDYIPKS